MVEELASPRWYIRSNACATCVPSSIEPFTYPPMHRRACRLSHAWPRLTPSDAADAGLLTSARVA